MCAIKRVVVVLPLVPVTATIGIRLFFPGGYNISITGAATFLGKPSAGARCILNPGPALTSITAPPTSETGLLMSLVKKSIPQISKPTIREIRSAINTVCGWTMSVTSTEVPPVERLAVSFTTKTSPLANTLSKV